MRRQRPPGQQLLRARLPLGRESLQPPPLRRALAPVCHLVTLALRLPVRHPARAGTQFARRHPALRRRLALCDREPPDRRPRGRDPRVRCRSPPRMSPPRAPLPPPPLAWALRLQRPTAPRWRRPESPPPDRRRPRPPPRRVEQPPRRSSVASPLRVHRLPPNSAVAPRRKGPPPALAPRRDRQSA